MTPNGGVPADGEAPDGMEPAGGGIRAPAASGVAPPPGPRGAGAALERLSAGCAAATSALCIVLAMVFVGCLLLQVVCRYVFVAPLSWPDEVAVLLFVWTVLLLASVGVREKFHVRFTFVIEALPPRGGRMMESLLMLAIVGFGVFMVISGSDLAELVWGNTSAAVRYPMQMLYLALPVSGALIVVHGLPLLVNGNFGR